MYHYVYEIRSGSFFYIGCRSSIRHPDRDVNYKGTGVWCLSSVAYVPRIKTILSTWDTREEAEIEESRLIRNSISSFGCMNRRNSSPRRKRNVQQAV